MFGWLVSFLTCGGFCLLVWFALVVLVGWLVWAFCLFVRGFVCFWVFFFLITRSVEYYLGLHIDSFLTVCFQGLPVTSYRLFDRCLEIGFITLSLK